MRIAQVAPLYESVPPKLYGGTERVVSYLTEELVASGHQVTLFASGDSRTRAALVPACPRSLRLDPACRDPLAHHFVMLEMLHRRITQFDLVHFHIDYLHFPLSRAYGLRQVTTLHGRLDLADLRPLYRHYADMPVVSISAAQREPLPWLQWRGTVHHGLPERMLQYQERDRGYLAFLGRISPEKGLDRAIDIARRAGLPLRVAAKIDDADREYYAARIEPLLRDPLVEFIGEIGEDQKQEFLGGALALLFPIDWPEPFGLVMIEALACGTPVIASRRASTPEVIEHGRTGFLVDDVDAAVAAARDIGRLQRADCRAAFEARFTASRMARDYVEIYATLPRADGATARDAGAEA
jgi:glycosyltransferase involved in cell wall biosynthesis